MAKQYTCDTNIVHEEAVQAVERTMLSEHLFSDAAEFFKIMGDRTRFRILFALDKHELCVCDLAWVVGASQGLVSHHLRQLCTNGLVSSRRDGKLVMYRLTDLGRQLLTTVGELETKAGA